jgi:hypothetical protein
MGRPRKTDKKRRNPRDAKFYWPEKGMAMAFMNALRLVIGLDEIMTQHTDGQCE